MAHMQTYKKGGTILSSWEYVATTALIWLSFMGISLSNYSLSHYTWHIPRSLGHAEKHIHLYQSDQSRIAGSVGLCASDIEE